MTNEAKWAIGLGACLLVLCLCFGVACVVSGGMAYLITQAEDGPGIEVPEIEDFQATVEANPSFSPTPTFRLLDDAQPLDEGAVENLKRLEEALVPLNDPHDLAFRLEGKTGIPETVDAPDQPLEVGAQETFWAFNDDTREHFEVEATLGYATEHLYFWIENGVDYDEGELRELCETFEKDIYPTDREFFGSEWTPGVDNDPHLYVLYAGNLGSNVAGYYSSMDELHPEVNEYSNAHEMFFMSSDNVGLGEEYIYGTMAHEFQHMIHWYRDRNESSWVNEGFSMLAELLNGYDVGGFDYVYTSDPDIQLTFWPSLPDSRPHYGQSFLFMAYFLDRFGEQATQAVVAHDGNSLDSIDEVMQEMKIEDPQTSTVITADDIFADWVITSYLNDQEVGDGRFAYQRYSSAPTAEETESIRRCPADWETRAVHQYGVDYIKIDCSGTYNIEFQGSTEVSVLPVSPYEGQYAFWSNKGDSSDMTLTHEFDFTGVTGPLTLSYQLWYDLEEDYDYVYLLASEDGEQWQFVQTPSGTDEDPSGNSYGWGYNGQTGGWKEEQVDLSDYAGKKVFLRFEYVTDMAVNGEGFMLDNLQIPEIDYSADFEADEGGWEAQGFVRIENDLPQTYRLSLIVQGRETSIQYIQLDELQTAVIPLTLSGNEEAILVVSGVARHTNQEAAYRFRVTE